MDPFKYYVNAWYRNRLNLANVFYCQIHITTRCQNSCKHCYFKELNIANMDVPIDQLLKLLDVIKNRAKDIGLSARVDFTGGDPLLYPYLHTVLDKCNELNIAYGFKCNPETIVQFSNSVGDFFSNSSGVSLSLDGLRETHDFYRKRGSFDCTIRAIEILKEAGISLRINTTISRNNVNNLIPLINFLIDEKIVVDDFTWARYWSITNRDEILTACELKKVFEEMTQYMRELFSQASFYIKTPDNRTIPQIMFGFKEHQWYPFFIQNGILENNIQEDVSKLDNCINCTATKHFYIIDPDLKIYKCRKLPETVTSIKDFGTYVALKYSKGLNVECESCKFYNGCGGCSAITKCFTGNITDTEPLCPYKALK